MNMTDEEAVRRMRFVLELRSAGVTDARALAALELTPRAYFAPPHLAGIALDDAPLPLACGQVMTKPSVIGRMLSALDVRADHKVLEIGAGSGYQAGALSILGERITSLERQRRLVIDARAKLGALRLINVSVHFADGRTGWAEAAPYDRIVVNAAAEAAPFALIEQLAPKGVLLIPIGEGGEQRLMRFTRGAGAPEDLGPIAFAALGEGMAMED